MKPALKYAAIFAARAFTRNQLQLLVLKLELELPFYATKFD